MEGGIDNGCHRVAVEDAAQKVVDPPGLPQWIGQDLAIAHIQDLDVGLRGEPILDLLEMTGEELGQPLVADGVGRLTAADEHQPLGSQHLLFLSVLIS